MKIKINNQFYNFFDDITINYKLDSVASTFSFNARFNPNNEEHKKIFRPLSYNKVQIFDNDNNLKFTGTSLNTSLNSSEVQELQNISGYSKSGILEDCTIPRASYPLERLNISLYDIAWSMVGYFDLKFIVDDSVKKEMDLIYPKTVAGPEETVKEFLSKLASQRNILLSHNIKGNLLFYKPNTKAKSKFFFNDQKGITMSLSVNGQAMHSKISVIRQPSKDNQSLSPVDTVNNNLVGLNRTIVKTLSSGTETDTKKAADNILADQLKNISVNVSIDRHIDVNCGDIVEVLNPEIFLYKKTRFMVSEITVNENNSSQSMTFNLVLPETFTGEIPKNIFL